MRQVLRLIGNRYGAAASILLVIAVVVVFGKLVGGSRTGSELGPDQGPPATAVSTGAGSTSSPAPDDGLALGPDTAAAPTPSSGAAPAETVAVNFAKAWLNHHGVSAANWHKGVSKYSTKTLADRLDGVDPGSVPADQMTGPAAVAHQEASYVEVTIPLDAGTLVLRMVVLNGQWLVDGVDWRRT
jgi:hypothetical protein